MKKMTRKTSVFPPRRYLSLFLFSFVSLCVFLFFGFGWAKQRDFVCADFAFIPLTQEMGAEEVWNILNLKE